MGRSYSSGSSGFSKYSSVDAVTAWGAATSASAPSIQFPSNATVNDYNIVAGSVVVSYVGAPGTVTGEVILGTVPDGALDNTTFSSLSFFPGFVRIPLSTLLKEGPMRVYMRKSSPKAHEFISPGTDTQDIEVPVIAITPTTSANAVALTFSRSHEVRPILSTANTLPYEKTTSSFVQDHGFFENACSMMSNVPVAVTEGYGEYFREAALGAFGALLGPSALNSAVAGITMGAGHLRRIGMGFPNAGGGRRIGGGSALLPM
jgi:hypothetical protein